MLVTINSFAKYEQLQTPTSQIKFVFDDAQMLSIPNFIKLNKISMQLWRQKKTALYIYTTGGRRNDFSSPTHLQQYANLLLINNALPEARHSVLLLYDLNSNTITPAFGDSWYRYDKNKFTSLYNQNVQPLLEELDTEKAILMAARIVRFLITKESFTSNSYEAILHFNWHFAAIGVALWLLISLIPICIKESQRKKLNQLKKAKEFRTSDAEF